MPEGTIGNIKICEGQFKKFTCAREFGTKEQSL